MASLLDAVFLGLSKILVSQIHLESLLELLLASNQGVGGLQPLDETMNDDDMPILRGQSY